MKFRTTLLSLVCLLLGGIGGHVAAQIALPPVQLPDAARTLPALPDLDAGPLISVGDRLTQVRLDRINALVMKDPRIDCKPEDMPFDGMRMFWGGFKPIVSL